MIKKLTLFLACLLLGIGMASAQTKVTGVVTAEEDGLPIAGATVQVVGSQVGTATDVDGTFTLRAPNGAKMLRVSYIGMQTQEVPIASNMNIVLKSSDTQLDEVVVTAMGIKREAKALGVSATPIKGDVIAQARTNDIMSSLAGKVAGVQIGESSSDPGTSKSVIIRGVSSLSGNNQPLYVVDGVPLNNAASYSDEGLDRGYDFGNGANAVNPNDVESMTILKGAAATALYGSRAGAGVILITTKKGTKQKRASALSTMAACSGSRYSDCRRCRTASVWAGMATRPILRTDRGVPKWTAPCCVTAGSTTIARR
jgi:TonB-dependent SusC/RagA subfamily outer membrane receptor